MVLLLHLLLFSVLFSVLCLFLSRLCAPSYGNQGVLRFGAGQEVGFIGGHD